MLVHNKRQLFDALDLASADDALAAGMSADEFARITQLSAWASSFLCQPHDDLGRVGPVCPYARSAIEHRLFLLGEINIPFDNGTELAQEIQFYKEWFVRLQEQLSPERQACIVLSLPQCDPISPDRIDQLQRELKHEFIAEQLMVGQFHPEHPEPGLWSPDFRPLAAPIPAIAIRRLVPSDLPFLVSEPTWVLKYLEVFASSIPRHTAKYLTELVVNGNAA